METCCLYFEFQFVNQQFRVKLTVAASCSIKVLTRDVSLCIVAFYMYTSHVYKYIYKHSIEIRMSARCVIYGPTGNVRYIIEVFDFSCVTSLD